MQRRRSGSVESVYEVPPRAPAMEPVERMEAERKKPRLEDRPGRGYLPNIRTPAPVWD